MNNIKEIQEFIREQVILAAHPEAKSYKEALKLEIGIGCIINCYMPERGYVMPEFKELQIINKYSKFGDYFVYNTADGRVLRFISNNKFSCKNDVIMGQSITLSRVLNAIAKIHEKDYHKMIFQNNQLLYVPSYDFSEKEACFKWKFLNKDGSEAIFQDQTPETQLAIAKLLGYESH